MHLWIVTIGSSDVQLDSDKVNKDKGRSEKRRSDKIWQYWYTDDLRADYYDIPFEPQAMFKDREESYRIAPRILGKVFQSSTEEVKDEIWNYLTFPLLDNFVKALEKYPTPEAIAILLTDQSAIFRDERKRGQIKSPYWQDTCELRAILELYFADRFSGIPCEWINLAPTSADQRLDNWDTVLDLVRQQFHSLTIRCKKIEIASDKNVYVSHQAGTPAISSAVQFCSLARFGDRVKFLVSNEYNQELTDILPSSNYLVALKRQQAEKLLEQHSYFAVKEIYSSHLSAEENTLLDAAIQWNFAEFGNFADQIESLTGLSKFHYLVEEVKERRQQWWWEAYEASYLGVIRLDQENTVEAFFHTFRAFEGLVTKWSTIAYPDDIDDRNGQSVAILKDESTLPQLLLKDLEELKEADKLPEIKLYGERLFELFRVTKPHLSDNEDLKPVWKKARNIRNQQFHRLKGLDASSLYKAWGMNSRSSWEGRILNCLKLISEQPHFKSLAKASLMSKVHRELKKAIAKL